MQAAVPYGKDRRDEVFADIETFLRRHREHLKEFVRDVPCAIRATDYAVGTLFNRCCSEQRARYPTVDLQAEAIGQYYGVPAYVIREFVYNHIARNIPVRPYGAHDDDGDDDSDRGEEAAGGSYGQGAGAGAAAGEEGKDDYMHGFVGMETMRRMGERPRLTIEDFRRYVRDAWCSVPENISKARQIVDWHVREENWKGVESLLGDVAKLISIDDPSVTPRLRNVPTAKQAVEMIAHSYGTTAQLVMNAILTECIDRH
jgi:hypothetical protein